MSKTIDEMIEAATIIEEELIGGDGTHAEIEGAVEKACPAWAEDDKEAALVLAAHVSADSDEVGRVFRRDVGHAFRSMSATCSD